MVSKIFKRISSSINDSTHVQSQNLSQFKHHLIQNNVPFHTSNAYQNLIFFGDGNFAIVKNNQIEINLKGWKKTRYCNIDQALQLTLN